MSHGHASAEPQQLEPRDASGSAVRVDGGVHETMQMKKASCPACDWVKHGRLVGSFGPLQCAWEALITHEGVEGRKAERPGVRGPRKRSKNSWALACFRSLLGLL